MLREKRERQQQMDVVILEQMIPEEHLLRKIDAAVDFSFIHDLCAPLYCENDGRPAIEPEILFRMLIVGYLYGIKSEARLEEEINYNLAYKWFCGLGLTEKAPDASTISQNRIRRFRDNNIAEQIFNEILRQCVEKRSFAEAKVNHGLRFARMCSIQNMREHSFLTAAVQNMKRLAKALYALFPYLKPVFLAKSRALPLSCTTC